MCKPIAEPDANKNQNTDVGGKNSEPITVEYGFGVLPQRYDQAHRKCIERAQRKHRRSVWQQTQIVALFLHAATKAPVTQADTQPAHEAAHARGVEQPHVDALRLQEGRKKTQEAETLANVLGRRPS